ncbi:MAG: ATP-binding protein [Alphaproteobacteria bacterium]
MDRYLSATLIKDSDKKIILLSGPRQAGKTTLTRHLFSSYDYFNYDASEDREALEKKHWKRNVDCVLFDELHKMPYWKRWLKGVYDTEGNRPRLIVTGSANLDTFRKVGDSLAGRYFGFRLHPIDLKEGAMYWKKDIDDIFRRLMECGGFPEPFLEGDTQFYRRWQKSHLDIILRQDFLDLYSVRSIKLVETLLELLKSRVSGPLSYTNLCNDLQIDPKTLKNWLTLLENIYAIFSVTPYHTNVARSLLKEPKLYFYDIGRVPDEGARLENLVACALLKEIHWIEDVYGHKGNLHYLKTKDGVEIDFLVTIDDVPVVCIEVKTSDDVPSKSFNHFKKFLQDVPCIQLVLHLKREFDHPDGIQMRDLKKFLATLDLRSYIKKNPN